MVFVSSLHLFCAYNERITSQKLKFALTRNSKKKVVIKYLFDFTLNALFPFNVETGDCTPTEIPSQSSYISSWQLREIFLHPASILSAQFYIIHFVFHTLQPFKIVCFWTQTWCLNGVRTRISVMVSGRTLGLTYNNKTPKFRKKNMTTR